MKDEHICWFINITNYSAVFAIYNFKRECSGQMFCTAVIFALTFIMIIGR